MTRAWQVYEFLSTIIATTFLGNHLVVINNSNISISYYVDKIILPRIIQLVELQVKVWFGWYSDER